LRKNLTQIGHIAIWIMDGLSLHQAFLVNWLTITQYSIGSMLSVPYYHLLTPGLENVAPIMGGRPRNGNGGKLGRYTIRLRMSFAYASVPTPHGACIALVRAPDVQIPLMAFRV
jgi:hypothetical protein